MIVWTLLMVSVWSVVSAVQTCGYQSCNPIVPGKINVHLVAHSHDDVGWLKTVDQYFLGANNSIQLAGVQYILDSVVQELLNDPQKRFIYVEVAFFARWWRQQHDMIRHRVRDLVNQGRLEFILGGWCMNDEATTHYNDIIDQHTLGFEFLRQNFGDCGRPRVAWQIDPFGHSREQASLFAQMGFDGLFFGRLDYQDKSTREQSKTMEMMWRGSPDNLGAHADLFTGVLPNTYSPPDGFCFDLLCYGPALNDDRRLKEYNMDEMVQKFIHITTKQREKYDTDQLIMTMGNDFNYQSANAWYKNLDKLIEHVNQADSNVHLLYSTPSCYLKAVNEQNVTLTTKSDDFFPYAHRPHSFWTGYFTSRPTLKYYVRQSNNFLQACKQLDALAFLEDTDNSTYEINILKKAMGVAQHHDAVSGTEKQHVAYDYAQRLAQGVAECQKVVNDAYKKLLPKNRTSAAPEQYFCNLLNISVCMASTHNKQFQVTIYNPLARRVDHWLRLPVSLESYEVRDYNGTKIPTQLIPIGKDTKRIPERGSSTLAKYSLVFSVSLPPLGFSTYFVSRIKDKRLRHEQRSLKRKFARLSGTQQVKNEFVSLEFDTTSGRLVRMTNLESSISISLQQDIFYYIGTTGNNSRGDLQASGAYVFRPNGSQAFHPKYLQKSYLLQGPLVQEVHQTFSPWVTQVVRLYNGARHAEFEWTVGPIPIGKNESKEVVSRFSSSILSQKVFYTDANGREVLRREADKRNTWDFEQTEPIAGNYYPVNSRIFIKDDNQQLTILTDRTQGGTSASNSNGVIDLMVHRRLFHDDGLGVGEPLNETGSDNKGLIARGTHYVHLDSPGRSASFHRQMGLKLYMQPIVSFSNSTMKQSDWVGKYHTSWSGLNTPLPDNLHLLTLEQWGAAGVLPSQNQPYLLRLENIFERGEDSYLSRNVTVDLNTLFKNITIQSVHELTLGANLPLTNLTRLQWLYNGSSPDEERVRMGLSQNTVTLQPMEIRTFQLNF